MLPSLRKTNDRQFSATETKVYYPPKQLSTLQNKVQRKDSGKDERSSSKLKVGGGFKLSNALQQSNRKEYRQTEKLISQPPKASNYTIPQQRSGTDLATQIKLIEKKIRMCQKKIEDDKRRKIEQDQRAQTNQYEHDFQNIVKRELQLQRYAQQVNSQEENRNFDYLTNPGKNQKQEVEEVEQPATIQAPKLYNIDEGVQKLQKFYQNSLKKKFERRQIFPHKPCRRKTPKLYITQKTNALNKFGKPQNDEEHRFRVFTKQTTPQQIYPIIPNFAVVKDNLSKNIVAYLGDYKPFLEKTKEKAEEIQKRQEQLTLEPAQNINIGAA